MIAAVLALAACGGGQDEGIQPVESTGSSVSSTSSTTTTTTLSPKEQKKQKVREAIQEWDAVITELNRDPDPNDPRIDEVLAPEAAEALRSVLERNRRQGQVSRPAEKNPINVFEVESIDLSSNPVKVMACSRNNVLLVQAGNVVNDDFEAAAYEVHLTKLEATYRVSSSERVSYVAKPAGTPKSEVQCESP